MGKAVSTAVIKVIFVTSKVALLVLGIASSGYCNESFYKNHARGWHWYEMSKESEEFFKKIGRASCRERVSSPV